MLSEGRIFLRLWGLVGIYAWAKRAWTEKAPHRDLVMRGLAWAQILCSTGFQACENVAFLAQKGVVLKGEKWRGWEGMLWRWSSRFWLASVGLEGVRLARVRQLGFGEEGAEEKEGKVKKMEAEQRWWEDVYSNMGWVPSSMHWSFFDEEDSPISEAAIGLGGMVPTFINLRRQWRETA